MFSWTSITWYFHLWSMLVGSKALSTSPKDTHFRPSMIFCEASLFIMYQLIYLRGDLLHPKKLCLKVCRFTDVSVTKWEGVSVLPTVSLSFFVEGTESPFWHLTYFFWNNICLATGTVYRKHEPIFFQSLGNPFIFRCIDGVLIDGNDKGLSRSVYR